MSSEWTPEPVLKAQAFISSFTFIISAISLHTSNQGDFSKCIHFWQTYKSTAEESLYPFVTWKAGMYPFGEEKDFIINVIQPDQCY